ncbi:hypothetical protein [Lysobacter gummosus]
MICTSLSVTSCVFLGHFLASCRACRSTEPNLSMIATVLFVSRNSTAKLP